MNPSVLLSFINEVLNLGLEYLDSVGSPKITGKCEQSVNVALMYRRILDYKYLYVIDRLKMQFRKDVTGKSGRH